MITGQAGIFALGDAAHGFFEFALRDGANAEALVRAVADLRQPRTTVGGVNQVVGFRPELWRSVAPHDAPAGVHGFEPLRGSGGYTMPATQADLWVWYAAAAYDIVFDLGKAAVEALAPLAVLARETTGWSYKHTRDLTGFEDGTENPTLYDAPEVVLIEDGAPGAGGSVLLFQQWRHLANDWSALADERQEEVIGRTKPDSVELAGDAMPADSHVSRTKVVENGDELPIFRRNVPYGTVSDHGTLFIGFSADQKRMHRMLEQMAGTDGGPRDALTRYTTPLTGAYYFVPSVQSLRAFTTPDGDSHAVQVPLAESPS